MPKHRAEWAQNEGGASDAVRAPGEYLAQPGLWPRLTCQVQGGARSTPTHCLHPWPCSGPPPVSSARMQMHILDAVRIPPLAPKGQELGLNAK